MSELAAFQRHFARAIAHPPIPRGPLSVYRNTALNGAVEALRDNYPVVRAIIGEAMFDNVAVDYAMAQPPNSPILALYGRRFADWIEAKCWSSTVHYLADVARIERLHIEALFAPDAPPMSGEALARIAPDAWNTTYLEIHPAVRFLATATPAMSIWLAHQCEQPGEIAPDWREEGALFTRPHSTVEAHILEAPARRLFTGLRQGESVGLAALATAERFPTADLGAVFGAFIEAGVFAAPPPTDRSST